MQAMRDSVNHTLEQQPIVQLSNPSIHTGVRLRSNAFQELREAFGRFLAQKTVLQSSVIGIAAVSAGVHVRT